MRAVRFHQHGGPDALRVDDVPRPDPGPHELLVRVEAASVNPVDTYLREGEYPPGDLPWITGSDAAGVVEAVGDHVSDVAEGDRVVATGLGNSDPGTCAEYVAVPAGFAGHLPDDVPFDLAAAGALCGVTAWRAFVDHADLDPTDRALVHGGNGGVGHLAVQLAAAQGAAVTATAAPEYHDRLRELGADAVVDYGRDDLADAVASAGAPDVVLGTVANETIDVDAEVAAHGATVVAIGNTEPTVPFPMGPAKFGDLRLQAMSMFNAPDTGGVLHRLARLIADGAVVPEIAGRYDLDGVPEAQERVVGESFLGKLVVEP